MKKAVVLLSLFLCSVSILFAQTPKVLILAIDGVRADAIELANTPNLDALMANGMYSYDAFTRFPTKTKPGWASLFSGVWREQHQVLSNEVAANNLERYPYFIKHLKNSDPAINSVWITGNGQGPIQDHVDQYISLQVFDYIDEYKKDVAIDLLTNQDPDVLVVHLGFVDFHGHIYSFSPHTPQYIDAIELADSQVGEIITAMVNRPNYSNEDWLVIGTTDHGGNGLNHGGSSIADRNIFFFVSGDAVPNQEIKADVTYKTLPIAPFLNGIDQFITLPNKSAYSFNQNSDFSIECRVKLSDTTNAQFIFSNRDGLNLASRGISLAVNPTGGNHLILSLSDGNATALLSGPSIADDRPHHISVTVDRSEFMSLYVDGFLYDQVKIDHLQNTVSPYAVIIGQAGNLNYINYLDGAVSEFRIWNCALNEFTIADYTCSSLNSNHPNFNRLAAHFPFNDGTGTIFANTKDTSASGQLTGSSLTWGNFNAKLKCTDYRNTPRIVDGAPTILSHFCVPVNPSWEYQGRSWVNKPCVYATCAPVVSTGAEDITVNSVRLTWSPQFLPDHYVLRGKRPEDENFRYFTILNPADTSFLVTKLRPNTRYVWSIQTVCDSNGLVFSDFTPLDTVWTLDCDEPTQLNVDSITENSARLTWAACDQASFYRVLGNSVLTENLLMDVIINGGGSTTFQLNNLTGGTEYYWKVRSECGVGFYSDYSNIDTFTTLNAKSGDASEFRSSEDEGHLTIHPNPLQKEAKITIHAPSNKSNQLILTDASGQLVRRIEGIEASTILFERKHLQAGVYFLQLNGGKQRFKLVVQ